MIGDDPKGVAQNMTAEHRDDPNLPTLVHREARMELSERFLDELVTHLREGAFASADEIPELYKEFQRQNAGLGDDFELGHTLAIALKRDLANKCLAESTPDKLPPDANEIKNALGLLKQAVFGQQP